MKTIFTNKISLIALIFAVSISANAKNYYASDAGNSSATGTLSNPLDITTAMSKSDLDTLFLRGGIYNLTATQRFNKTGTVTARKAMFAYNGEKPVLDFRNQAYGNRGVQFSGAYLHVKGITIAYSGKNGFYNEANYSIFENCETYGNGDTGFQLKSCHGNLVKNCDSHDNFDYKNGDISAADFGGNADGFADKQYTDTGDPNVYDGCRAWNNSDDGWDFFQRIGNTQIKNSICYKNGQASYDMTNHPRKTVDAAWFAQFPRNVVDADGQTVAISLANYKNFGNGNGFKLGGDYTAHNVTVTNCLSAQNTVKGFDQNNNNGSMVLYNCTGYNNGNDYGFSNSGYGSLEIKNCVSLSSIGTNSFRTKTVVNQNNSWNTTGCTCTVADFLSIDPTVILTPRNADGSLANITFMHLAEGSDLIDRGLMVGLPYAGNAPDMGCYEFGNYDNFPPAVTTPPNRNQSLTQNQTIENIVFTWSGGATGLTVSGLSNNLDYAVNESAKTLTIYGTPSSMGACCYTVTTVGGAGNPVQVTGTITVSSANAKKIAYVTIPNNAADALILEKLNANLNFKITIIDATATNVDYSSYDLIVISSVPASSSAGLAAIENVNKPRLLLKPFLLQSTRWGWSSVPVVNTTQTTVSISDKSHEIFNNLTFTGTNNDELPLFSSVSTYAVTGITSWTGNPSVSLLGVAKGTTTQSVVEIPVGTVMNGTTVGSRFLMIGVSEYSTANLTPTATQLIENSCYYLMSLPVPTGIFTSTQEEATYTLLQQGNTLIITGSGSELPDIRVYSISGILMKTAHNTDNIDVNGLAKGVYIVQIITGKKQNTVFKFMIR